MGFVGTTAYDAASNVISTTNPRGYTTTFAYDALNRQTQATNALGGLATTVYDLVGNVNAQVDQRGNRTTFAYDAANRRTTQTDPLNHIVTTVYDLVGNVIKTIDALGFTTTMNYDADNRQTSVIESSGGIVTTAYDSVGNVTNTIDQLGDTTTFVFDPLNRQTFTTDARGGITTTVYDAASNTVNVIDSVGNKTTFVFDALNRETQMIDPLGNSATFAFDKASRMTSTTDRDGRRRDFSFDNDSRKTGETWVVSGSTTNLLTFSYDKNSNLLTAADYHGMYTMAYDALDRMTAVQEPFGQILTSILDPVGNRTVLQDSLGGITTSVYDAANRLTNRQFTGSLATLMLNLSYTARNQIATETRFKDLTGTTTVAYSTMTYDAKMRLVNLDHQNGSGTNLANYTYGYDLANRLTTETLNGGTPITYSYDKTNQLNNDSQVTYTYDLNGNRTMTGYGTRGNNELTSDPIYGTYLYDAEGNMTGRTNKSTGEVWTFGYDNLNHMTSAIDKNSSGTTLTYATYIYDVFGNRIEKDVWQTGGSTTTRFAWDNPVDPSGLGGSGNIWADLNSSNGLVTRYIFADGLDKLIARISSSGTAAWFLTDRLGSVRNITDNSGSVIDTITYDGFGNITNESQSSNGGRFKFNAREADSETGLQFNRARYYDPKTGRWTSQDPLQVRARDTNFYRYVFNNATNSIDPSGLLPPLFIPVYPNTLFITPPHQVNILFHPLLSEYAKCCDQIGHVQEVRIVADGKGLKPGDYYSKWSYRNAWELPPDHYFIDTLQTVKSPFWQDAGFEYGKFGHVNENGWEMAEMGDVPQIKGGDKGFFRDKDNKTGWKKVTFYFRTFAACKTGKDCPKPKFYEGVYWNYTMTAEEYWSNKPGKITVTAPNVYPPEKVFIDEYEKFNMVVGYKECGKK